MSNEKNIKISSREKNYYTTIPNVVIDMFENGIISKNSYIFYITCRRVAGESGTCWMGRNSFLKKLKCSSREIQKAKDQLTKPYDFLHGKSLLVIEKTPKGSEDADHIMVEDIWFENILIYRDKSTRQKFPTLFPGEQPPVPIGTTPMFPGEHKERTNTKKEPIKKERTSVHKSTNAETRPAETCETLRSSSLFKEVENETSLPSEKPGQHIDELYEEQLQWLLSQKTTESEKIDEKQVLKWLKKYDIPEITKAIKYTKETHKKSKKGGVKNFYAFTQARLDYLNSEKAKNIEHNGIYFQNVTDRGYLTGFISTKDYCYHQNNRLKEVYFHLPPEEFKKQLERCK